MDRIKDSDNDEPPPSYYEAMQDTGSAPIAPPRPPVNRPGVPPPTPQRPPHDSHHSLYQQPPQHPARPQAPQLPQRPHRTSHPSSSSSHRPSNSPTDDLYTGNPDLPFRYPRGYFCQKCKNTGYKKSGGICYDCWDKHYLNKNAYNPNPSLPFRYPKRYLCEKCHNTGYKKKNGKSCQDCWTRFGPRNRPQVSTVNDFFGSTSTIYSPPGGYGPPGPFGNPSGFGPFGPPQPPPGPGIRVPPGDPRLGGILCGRCRGLGLVYGFLFDEDLCPVCQGLGRIIHLNR